MGKVEKLCRTCNRVLPLSGFYKKAAKSDGYDSQCMECKRKYNREYSKNNREYFREYVARRSLDPVYSEKRKTYLREYRAVHMKNEGAKKLKYASAKRQRKANPMKFFAREKVKKSVLQGKVSKLPCFVCGEIKVEAHHADYSKPLDVVWLCRAHHQQLHIEALAMKTAA